MVEATVHLARLSLVCIAWLMPAAAWGMPAFVDSGQRFGSELRLANGFEFATGRGRQAASGDLDRDGDLDLVVVNFHPGFTEVWHNQPHGFVLAQYFEAGAGEGVALADMDGDGWLDYVGTQTEDFGQLEVRLNDGSGRFAGNSRRTMGASGIFQAVAVGDLNNDGTADVAFASGGHQAGSDYPNGAFILDSRQSPMFIRSFDDRRNNTEAVALGDLNGDGFLDAVYGNRHGAANVVRLNDGAGDFVFGQSLGADDTYDVKLGDLDGDGDLDVFVANAGGQPDQVWLNDGSGRLINSAQTLGAWDSHGVALGDLDGDGDLDALVAGGDGPSVAWLNNGDGSFTDSGFRIEQTGAVWPVLDDFDGDGDLDVFLVSDGHPNRLWLSDLIEAGPDSPPWARDAMLAFVRHAYPHDDYGHANPDARLPSQVVRGDIDNDGDLDVVVGFASSPTEVWRNDGGVFALHQLIENHAAVTVVLVDFNNDGWLDYAAGGHIDGLGDGFEVRLNDGAGHFNADTRQTLGGGAPEMRMQAGDLDNDGYLDLVVAANRPAHHKDDFAEARSFAARHNLVIHNDGGRFGEDGMVSLSDVLLPSLSVSLGDLNGDGFLDAVFANGYRTPSVVRLNDGRGNLVFAQSVGAASIHDMSAISSYDVDLADLDGDGDLDAHFSNGRMMYHWSQDPLTLDTPADQIWLNDGFGGLQDSGQRLGGNDKDSRALNLDPSKSRGAALGDVDGDGDIDIFVVNSGQYYRDGGDHPPARVWLNNGGGVFDDSGLRLAAMDEQGYRRLPALSRHDVALGDFDLDGALDAFVVAYDDIAQRPVHEFWQNNGAGGAGRNAPPVADAGTDGQIVAGDIVRLDGSASFDPEGQPLSYQWVFISRPPQSQAWIAAASDALASFVADATGEYVLGLTVSDGHTDSAQAVITIAAINTAPVAAAGSDLTTIAGRTVRLDGGASHDPDGHALHFGWSMLMRPDGSDAAFEDADTVNPSFAADTVGRFLLALSVRDPFDETAVDTVTVTVINNDPVADAGVDQTVVVGDTVQLNGSGNDEDGHELSYAWRFLHRPQASTATLDAADTAAPAFTADIPGEFRLALTVYDAFGASAEDTITVNVKSRAQYAGDLIDRIMAIIDGLPDDQLRNKDVPRQALHQFNQVRAAITVSRDDVAVKRLDGNIVSKLDGCHRTGHVHRRDWVQHCDPQAQIWPLLMELRQHLAASADQKKTDTKPPPKRRFSVADIRERIGRMLAAWRGFMRR